MATVRELVTRLGFNVDNSGLNKYEKGTERVKENANNAAASFRNMFAAFAGIAAIRSIAGIADSMQSLEARIGMLPQTVGDAGKAFDEVSKNATANRQSLEAYGTLYARVGNAAKDYITTQEDLLTVSNTISQALVVGGSTAQEAASVMTQFSQALGAGTLQGEEFRAMAEAAPQYMDELAIALGHPRAALKKLASEGKITSKDVIEATLKMSTLFQDKFNKMPMTIGQATTVMGNKWATFIARFNRESQVVTKVANFIVGAMDKISAGLDSFTEFVGGANNALNLLMIVAGAMFALMLHGWIAAAALTLAATWPILLMAAALVGLGILLEDVYGWFMGYDSMLGDTIGGVEKWGEEVENVKTAFKGLMAIASVLWENVLRPILGFSWFVFLQGLELVANTFRAVLSIVSAIVDGVRAVGNFLGVGGPTPTGAVKPSAAAMADTWKQGSQTQENTFNITMPPGSPAATQEAARAGVTAALNENPNYFAQQMGQAL